MLIYSRLHHFPLLLQHNNCRVFHSACNNNIFSGVTLEKALAFTVSCLKNTTGEVRDVGRRLIVWLYQRGDKQRVRSALPPDTQKIRQKNQLYKMIFEEFDRIDGKLPGINKQTRFQGDTEAQQLVELKRQNAELQKILQNKQQPQQFSPVQAVAAGQSKQSRLIAPRSYKLNNKRNNFDGNENQRTQSVSGDAPYATFKTEQSQSMVRTMSYQDMAPMADPMDDRYVFGR